MFLEIEQLRKSYGTGENKVEVLKGIQLGVEKGKICVLLGPSGSGKSTLLNIVGGIDTADSGSVTVAGEVMQGMNDRQLTEYRRKHLGYVFQAYNLIGNLTVRENIEVGAYLSSQPLDIDELLDVLGLTEHQNKIPSQLSGGQQQRVAIARALATNPKILLCDEATSALDPTTTRSILALLKEINKTLGITIIVITHEMAVIEEICQRVAIIDSSRIAEVGTVDEVFTRPKSAMAKQLIYPDGKRNSLATGKRYCRIVFDGNSSFEPVISNMVLECKAPVNIMFADTKNMDGKAYGQMILQLPEDERAAKRALAYLETQNVHAEEVADYASV